MKIISFVAIKGGVGKTTLAYNYGEYLASVGKKVLFIDFDLQCNLTQTYGIYQNNNTVANIFLGGEVDIISVKENIDLIAGYNQLDDVERQLDNHSGKNMFMYMWLSDKYEDKNLDSYDVVIIDCRPDFSLAVKNAIVVSHCILSPITPSKYGYEAKFNIQTRLEKFKAEAINYSTRESYVTADLYFLANMIKHNTSTSKALTLAVKDDRDVIGLIPYKELFNKSTLGNLPVVEMKKVKDYQKHSIFFTQLEEIFQKMSYLIGGDFM